MIQSINTAQVGVGFTKPVLLIGNKGMLGNAWAELFDNHSIAYRGYDIEDIDITDLASVRSQINDEFGVVINCAAWTDVDGAEEHCEAAHRINVIGVQNLAMRCKEIGAKLVQFSTDYVFDGKSEREYEVTSTPKPVSVYGETKFIGENVILESGCDHLLVRTSWMYAPWGKNFPKTISRLILQRPTIKVVDDQRGRPTSAQNLAQRCLLLLQLQASGLYHICDGGTATWYEFACEIASHVDHQCDIQPCTTEEFPLAAMRPQYSVMSLRKVERETGKCLHWKLALSDVMKQMSLTEARKVEMSL